MHAESSVLHESAPRRRPLQRATISLLATSPILGTNSNSEIEKTLYKGVILSQSLVPQNRSSQKVFSRRWPCTSGGTTSLCSVCVGLTLCPCLPWTARSSDMHLRHGHSGHTRCLSFLCSCIRLNCLLCFPLHCLRIRHDCRRS